MSPFQVVATVVLSLWILFAIFWVVLGLTMPGETKALTDAFRRRKP